MAAQTPAPAPAADAKAPDHFKVQFDTNQGPFVVEVNRADAPIGVDRFYALVTSGFYDQARFFRIVPGFVVQFGLPANPADSKKFPAIKDDPYLKGHKNDRCTVTFAKGLKPNTRTTQLFINLDDNRDLDQQKFPPIGRVISGMKLIYNLYSDYGEAPDQNEIHKKGNAYLKTGYPNLDYIVKASVLP